MKKLFLILLLCLSSVWGLGETRIMNSKQPVWISVESSCKSHLVHVNEPFEFIIDSNKKQKLKVVISQDGEAVLKKLTVVPPARVTVSLPYPGFVRCSVTSDDPAVKEALCGVGVDPYQLRPLLPEPEDFDEFWANTLKELAKIPTDFKMTKVGSNQIFNYYRISCANLNGQRAYAMLSLPLDPAKKMPLLMRFAGGDAYISENAVFESEKENLGFECAKLCFQLPPYPPVKKREEAKARHEKFMKKLGLRRYPHFGIEDRNRFYARTAVAGALRLLDEVLKQPGIDPARVGYCGSSHGGGLGLLLAAFSDKIKAAYCGVPNFGDRGGFLTGRHTPDSNSPEYRSHLETLLYFDTSYAARRIRIPVMISVGFTDVFCPPSAVYTIYNELKGPKVIFNKILHGHAGGPPECQPMINVWLSKQLSGE